MKFLRLIFLAFVWLIVSGNGSGMSCVPTDQPFGVVPEKLEPAAWQGYWCGPAIALWCPAEVDSCCRVTVNEDPTDELLLDGLGDNAFSVYKLRHVPRPGAIQQFDPKGDGFWFVFGFTYWCGESECERMADELGGVGWALLRKDSDEVVIWTVNEEQLFDALSRFELPGQLISDDEYGLLGSLMTEAQVRGLLDSRYFELNYKSPSVQIRSSD
jgi:hypothetical protein